MQYKSDCVAIFSGGLDSTTLVYDLLHHGMEPHLISFDYGQRHRAKELDMAGGTAFRLGLQHDIIDLTGITHLISNSALTSNTYAEQGQDANEIEVPEGHYAEENMKLTVVPNRNMIMLSIAAGVAVNNSYKFVATGVHAGDHFVYPDCRPAFIDAANAAVVHGNIGFGKVEFTDDGDGPVPARFIFAPFMHMTKTDIAIKAFQLDVPLEETWSCYKGEAIHCGKCGTCVERLEAIHDAAQNLYGDKAADMGMFDPTQYADTDFWRTAKAPE
jgi:7-cyano-7-deazaguanine synthase